MSSNDLELVARRPRKARYSVSVDECRVSLHRIQAWRPYRKKDVDMLERVQRRATKIIQKLRDISYEMRLKECGLITL